MDLKEMADKHLPPWPGKNTVKNYIYWRSRGYRASLAWTYAKYEARTWRDNVEFVWGHDEISDLYDLDEEHDKFCREHKRLEWEYKDRPTFRTRRARTRCEHVILYCQMVLEDGEEVGSLGGHIDPDEATRRETEAELAWEYYSKIDSVPLEKRFPNLEGGASD